MQKRRILINAIMSVTQILVVSGILFFLYKFLLKTIGVEKIGIWSLVLATTSAANIANLGLSGSVVKFVAKYFARGDNNTISGVIQTASISIAVIIGSVLLIAYPLIKWVLKLVVPEGSIELAIMLLPYSLFSLWLTAITGIFQSGLDGLQRIYIRNILMMSGSIVYATLCFFFAPRIGLIGLAYAQIINNFLLLTISWILIRRFISELPLIPCQWSKALFREIISYGINFQIVSITIMFYDPVTKALLSKFGGLSIVGYYEMANRMIQQFRALIVSANQVLVPSIADLQEKEPERISSVYITNYRLLFYLAMPLYTLIIVSTPFVSIIWIGKYEISFALSAILLAVGNLLNTLAGPSYFANLGIGKLKWNVISHLAIAILNAVLGIVLGVFFGGIGVIVGWIVAFSLGSAVIYVSFHIINKIPLLDLLPNDSRLMAILCLVMSLVSYMLQPYIIHKSNAIMLNIMLIIIVFSLISIMLYLHPMRRRLQGWIVNDLLNKKV